jgi:hypothetical protein
MSFNFREEDRNASYNLPIQFFISFYFTDNLSIILLLTGVFFLFANECRV